MKSLLASPNTTVRNIQQPKTSLPAVPRSTASTQFVWGSDYIAAINFTSWVGKIWRTSPSQNTNKCSCATRQTTHTYSAYVHAPKYIIDFLQKSLLETFSILITITNSTAKNIGCRLPSAVLCNERSFVRRFYSQYSGTANSMTNLFPWQAEGIVFPLVAVDEVSGIWLVF